MPENANKTINIPVDEFNYYIRRDEKMSLIEKMIHQAIETDNTYIEAKHLLMFFE